MKISMKVISIKFTFLVLLINVYGETAKAQERIEHIGNREYQLVDSHWIFLSDTGDTIRFSPQIIIVRFKEHVIDTSLVKERLRITDLKITRGPTRGGFYVFHVPTDTRGFDVVRSLTGDPYVESVTFSIYGERLSVPNDPRWSDQWNLPKINMANTWDITLGDTSVVIAIIDSGADLDHEDLENSLWHGIGFNFVQPHLEPYESWTHGTPVAGIAGAQSNNGSPIISGEV